MLHLLLLHSAVIPLLLVYCCKHQEDKTVTLNGPPTEKNEGVKNKENKRLDNLKKKEQSDEKKKKPENDKGAVHDEKENQKREEGNKAGNGNNNGTVTVGEDGIPRINSKDPDYIKLANMGLTEAEIKANNESYFRWCLREKLSFEPHYLEDRRRDLRMMRRDKGEIVESSTQNSYNCKEDKEEESKKENSDKSKSM